MKRFEYKVHTIRSLRADDLSDTMQAALDGFGAEGWELVTCVVGSHSALCVFKRLAS